MSQNNETVVNRENRIKSYWENEKTFKQSIDLREGQETFVFYEGPPTANGLPHAGHVLGRVIKDFVARYKTMQGYQVLRKGGWDTHGLPVELGVEKKIGISGKQDIEAYGIEKFVEECKQSVFDYEREWRKFTEAIGYWVDMDDPYVTLHNRYIESVWYILSAIHKKGLLDRGHRVAPYCPSCQTSLSSHEVAQGYKDVKDLSVMAKFKVADSSDEFFLGWTTTPWTLPANVALAVHKDLDYVKVKHGESVYIVAENRLSDVFADKEYTVVSRHKGAEFAGVSYEPLFPFLNLAKGFTVVKGDFVTESSGTGIVHLAPAYGEDDYNAVRENGLDFVNVLDQAGCYTHAVPPLAGEFAKDCDVKIIQMLAEQKLLFSKDKYEHSYPHCWRCDSPLIYYATEGWFIKTTAIKQTILNNNETVEWYPDHMKHGRFGNFLENMVDWNIGRSRYWGTPLNIWICGTCQHQYAPESRHDLEQHADSPVADNLDLHRPYVDGIALDCPACRGKMTRTEEVIDVWFDSGSMPFAQYHYPFENKELFNKQFPADVIAEGVDQTRGWFYSLLAVSSLFTGKAPYKRVLSLGHILDEEGRKMSKSKGNVINPMELVDEYGADALRWALLADSAPWNNKRFSARLVSQAKSKIVDTLDNVHSFYSLYAGIDQFSASKHSQGTRALLDEWVLSRLQTVTGKVSQCLDSYDFTAAAGELARFIDEISNWYIRRSRHRFWSEGMSGDKLAAYHTLNTVLTNMSRLLAPFIPFIAEDIHLNLTGESVHVADFPKPDKNMVNEQLEKEMEGVLQVVELARSIRNTMNIKTKQPLAGITVSAEEAELHVLKNHSHIIQDEVNVKQLFLQGNAEGAVRYKVKLHFPTAGPKLGKNVRYVQEQLKHLPEEEAKQVVQQGYFETEAPSGERLKLDKEDLQFERSTGEGMELAANGTYTVLLNTVITDELRHEGFIRELIRAIQQYRKESGLPVEKRVNLTLDTTKHIQTIIEKHRTLIEKNVLVAQLSFSQRPEMKQLHINDEKVWVGITE